MHTELPVVFLAFANALDDHLANLKVESRDIFRALQPLQENDRLLVHREESSEFDELYQDLLTYGDRIVIFHYGGHADGTMLQLEGGVGGAGGIAGLLGQQSALKLVFLNGCATKDQVLLLHKAGVPAVIATAVKINDARATQFSTAFYGALVEGRSITQAFDAASAYIEGKAGAGGSEGISISRFPKHIFEEEETEPEVFEWALYLREEASADLEQWRLPEAREDWRVQLSDSRGAIRDLDGEPVLVEHRSRTRTVNASQCSACGTTLSRAGLAEHAEAPACALCGSGNVENQQVTTALANRLLPFGVDEDDARVRVQAASGVDTAADIALTPVYLPYWVFDVDTRTDMKAERGINQALAEVAPKLEWESVSDTVELSYKGYLLPGSSLPNVANLAGEWYWELEDGEPLQELPEKQACIPLTLSMEAAFGQFSAHFDRDLEAAVIEKTGGHQQRNISTDTRYRTLSAKTLLLPHWAATIHRVVGPECLLVNGQSGAVRSLQLPGTIQLNEGSQSAMATRTYEPNEQQAGSSRAISVFSGIGIGLMVGTMLGLSMSPTVATFVGAIGAALAALLGLNDRHFSGNKGLRIGAFGLAALVGAAGGMYAKNHGVFGPSLVEQKDLMMKAGFSECQAQDLLSGLSLRLSPPKNETNLEQRKQAFMEAGFTDCQALALLAGQTTSGKKAAPDQPVNSISKLVSGIGLMSGSVETSECKRLKYLGDAVGRSNEDVHYAFEVAGKGWQAYTKAVVEADFGESGTRTLLLITRDAVCPPAVQPTKTQCKQLQAAARESTTALASVFREIEVLAGVEAGVRKALPTKQAQALPLLVGALCKDE